MATTTTTITSKDVRNSSLIDDDFKPIDWSYAGIQDNKLALLTTSGKVANSATTATSANTADSIVARDATGSFAAGNISVNTLTSNSFATNTLVVDYLTVTTSLVGSNASASFGSIWGKTLEIVTSASIASLVSSYLNINVSANISTLTTTTENNVIRSYYSIASLPTASTVRGMFAIVSDDGYLYYSNGTIWVKVYSAAAVDGLATGLYIHAPCVAGTTANITLSGLQTIDGISVTAGQRVLVKDQSTTKDNGIYIVVTPGAWTRATDANTTGQVKVGMYTLVLGGTVNQNAGWAVYSAGTLNTDPVLFNLVTKGGKDGITSATLTAPAEINVAGSPITSIAGTGTFGLTWATQAPNSVFAGPYNTLVNGTPTFRALQSSDLPVMVGATVSLNGITGAVPAPSITDRLGFLKGDGTWVIPGTTTDLGSVSSVGLTGGTTGLSVLGSPVTTSGVMSLSGVLDPTHGGTGLNAYGTTHQFLRMNATADGLEWYSAAGSFTTAGSAGDVQYAGSSGSLAADTGVFTYDPILHVLTATTYHGNGSALTGLTPTQVGLGSVTNNAQAILAQLGVATTGTGILTGIATLDGSGKLTSSQIPTISAAWGSITGSLAAQTDLSTALANRVAWASVGGYPVYTAVAALDGTGKVPVSQLPAGAATGSGIMQVVTKTFSASPYTASKTNDTFIIVDASSGAVSIVLPDIATSSAGKVYYIKKVDSSANAVTVSTTGVDTVEGGASVVISIQGEVYNFIRPDTGTNWSIF